VDAACVYRTDQIAWNEPLAKVLLPRVLSYVDEPPSLMVDPTIRRENGGTFQITVGGNVHKGCIQGWAPAPGRWTTILKASGSVFKLRYLLSDAEHTEAEILKMIHSPGEIPGVVRMGWYGLVKREDGRNVVCPSKDGQRRKVCLELKDEGELFMRISTPYEALVAVWDLLEGSTFLHLSFCC